jgi:hypothetical protein
MVAEDCAASIGAVEATDPHTVALRSLGGGEVERDEESAITQAVSGALEEVSGCVAHSCGSGLVEGEAEMGGSDCPVAGIACLDRLDLSFGEIACGAVWLDHEIEVAIVVVETGEMRLAKAFEDFPGEDPPGLDSCGVIASFLALAIIDEENAGENAAEGCRNPKEEEDPVEGHGRSLLGSLARCLRRKTPLSSR